MRTTFVDPQERNARVVGQLSFQAAVSSTRLSRQAVVQFFQVPTVVLQQEICIGPLNRTYENVWWRNNDNVLHHLGINYPLRLSLLSQVIVASNRLSYPDQLSS